MAVRFEVVEDAFISLRLFVDRLVDVEDAHAGEPVETFDEHAAVVERGNDRQIVFAAESEVLLARTGRGVDYSGALGLGYFIPLHDPVLHSVLRGKLVERPSVLQADQICAGHLFQDFDLASEHRQPGLREIQDLVAVPDLHVCQVRMNGRGDVGRQCPGGGRPDQEGLTFQVLQRELDEQAGVDDLDVALGDDLVL